MDLSINGEFLFLTTASSEIGTSLAILYPWSHFLPLCQSVLGQPHQPCLTGALTCVLPLLPHRLAFLHLSEHITFFLKRVGRLGGAEQGRRNVLGGVAVSCKDEELSSSPDSTH